MFIYVLMEVLHLNCHAFIKKCVTIIFRHIFIQTNNFRILLEDSFLFCDLFLWFKNRFFELFIKEWRLKSHQVVGILLFVRVDDPLTAPAQDLLIKPPLSLVKKELSVWLSLNLLLGIILRFHLRLILSLLHLFIFSLFLFFWDIIRV